MILVIAFIIIIFSAILSKKRNENEWYTIEDVERLEQILNHNCNGDGGYHEILNTDLYKGDLLYFTYYSLLTFEKMDYPYEEVNKILKETVKNISIESFIKENYFDNLSNIYYFVEITKMLNLDIDERNISFIREYVSNLQTKEGCFALSEKQKQKVDLHGIGYIKTGRI